MLISPSCQSGFWLIDWLSCFLFSVLLPFFLKLLFFIFGAIELFPLWSGPSWWRLVLLFAVWSSYRAGFCEHFLFLRRQLMLAWWMLLRSSSCFAILLICYFSRFTWSWSPLFACGACSLAPSSLCNAFWWAVFVGLVFIVASLYCCRYGQPRNLALCWPRPLAHFLLGFGFLMSVSAIVGWHSLRGWLPEK